MIALLALATLALAPQEGARVLVVMNELRPEGRSVADHYIEKRKVPPQNLLVVRTSPNDEVGSALYGRQIEARVREKLSQVKGIDTIVLVKGVPLRLDNREGNSVDSMLAAMDLPPGSPLPNPYYGLDQPHNHAKTGLYLVARLDGYTVDDAKRLVDRALAARAETGPFLLDAHTSRSPGYKQANEAIQSAGAMLRARHARVMLDTTDAFQTPTTPLAGYVSWGSNDANYSEKGYRGLKFKPGALAETFVSTSARTFSKVKSGQSLIADLVAGGVTGVKGYVAEPTTRALANPAILFERYLDGHNLAESFAMASPLVRWKDVVVGDPLCRPHDRTR